MLRSFCLSLWASFVLSSVDILCIIHHSRTLTSLWPDTPYDQAIVDTCVLNPCDTCGHLCAQSLLPPAGILMITFCRTALAPHVGEVTTSSVACGLLGMAGNKGASAISLCLYRRWLCDCSMSCVSLCLHYIIVGFVC